MTDTGYNIRNYRPEDFARYVLLCQEAKELRPSGHAATPEIVRKWLAWPYYEPEKDLFLLEKDGELVGGLDLRPEPNIDRLIFNCWIHPEHRRNGLGRKLVESTLQNARQHGIDCIHVNVPGNNNVARTVLSRHGFKPVRRFLELKLDLSLIDRRQLEEFNHECRYLASGEEEDKIISYCWVEIVTGIGTDDGPTGEIHMIGSDPEYQGKGIGKKVLLAGLAYLKDKGIKTAYLSVDGENQSALALYYTVGFELFQKTIWYEKKVG